MKRFLLAAIILFTTGILSKSNAQQAFLSQPLLDKMNEIGNTEQIPIMVLLNDQVDMETLKIDFIKNKIHPSERAKIVNQLLRKKANETQGGLISAIQQFGSTHYSNIQSLWIANILILDADKTLIYELQYNPAVDKIDYNKANIKLIEPVKAKNPTPKSEGGNEPGLEAIGAPLLWAMGYTGQGRIAYSVDTGIWPDHPAFSDRFLPNLMPYSRTWFAYDSEVPVDKSSSHGTHTMGTVLGLEHANNDTIGVAFNAYFIASDPVVSNLANVKPLTDFMFAYQWALDPDGDPETSNDIPDVINNSWGFGPDLDEAPCPDFVVPVFNAVEAAGIANAFSAGNEGPGTQTISVPHNTNTGLVNSFTVGAVNAATPALNIAGFSSRGPSICGGEGSLLIKPEVSAPGVDVRSAIGHGEYDYYSGTSMAAPHVTGAVLLLKEAFPYLSGEDILLALYYSATDLGSPGEDNTYGMGMINVYDAFNYLAVDNTPVAPATPDTDIRIVEVLTPQDGYVCEDEINPIIQIKNTGTNSIEEITVNAQLNAGTITSEVFLINLPAGEEVSLNLTSHSVNNFEKQELHVWIDELTAEYDKLNNHAVSRFVRLAEVEFPLSEDFENGIPESWKVVNSDNDKGWDTIPTNGLDGSTLSAWINLFNYYPLESQRDYLMLPYINLPEGEPAYLNFDYSYRKRSTIDLLQDSIFVAIVDDCGSNFNNEIFKIGGVELYTNDTIGSNSIPQYSSDWRTASIDLSDFSGQTIMPAIGSINQLGNNVYIDNVNISPNPISAIINIRRVETFILFPNPAKEKLNLIFRNGMESTLNIRIFDINGKIIKEDRFTPGDGQENFKISVSDLSEGMYIISVIGRDWISSKRFVKI